MSGGFKVHGYDRSRCDQCLPCNSRLLCDSMQALRRERHHGLREVRRSSRRLRPVDQQEVPCTVYEHRSIYHGGLIYDYSQEHRYELEVLHNCVAPAGLPIANGRFVGFSRKIKLGESPTTKDEATDATKTTSAASDRLLQELVAPATLMLVVDWVQLWSDWRVLLAWIHW
jgi:hypothetical protein